MASNDRPWRYRVFGEIGGKTSDFIVACIARRRLKGVGPEGTELVWAKFQTDLYFKWGIRGCWFFEFYQHFVGYIELTYWSNIIPAVQFVLYWHNVVQFQNKKWSSLQEKHKLCKKCSIREPHNRHKTIRRPILGRSSPFLVYQHPFVAPESSLQNLKNAHF